MSIEITIHGIGSGVCSLSGKECEGVTVSFRDGTLTESFLSHKSFMQLVRMKAARLTKPEHKPSLAPSPNGPVVVK